MNFNETLESLDLAVESGAVPLIIGESGIGKTALMRKYSSMKGYDLVSLDANLLKEGEIGGLPTVENGRTLYATHTKLMELKGKTDDGNRCVLFVDEINRCDHAVQQELMNLILNREINGYKLNDGVIVTSAMNPPSAMEEFRDTSYQVTEMDPAQKNRFVWLKMDSDPGEWIIWGIGEGNIHPKVTEFISSFRNFLKSSADDDFIEATPRSWERISHALKVFDKKGNYSEKTLYNFIKGNVGTKIAQDFMNFLKTSGEGNLSAEDIMSLDVLTERLKDETVNSSHSVLYLLMLNLLRIADEKGTEESAERVAEVLALYPRDLRISLMKEIREVYKETLYKKLLENDVFLDSFYDCYV